MPGFLSVLLAGVAGGLIAAGVVYRLLPRGIPRKASGPNESPSHIPKKSNQQKKEQQRLEDMDRRLKRFEEEKLRATEKRIGQIENDLQALEQNVVRPIQDRLSKLCAELGDVQSGVEYLCS